MNILEIQERLPWGIAYGEGFKLNPTTYKDFQHAMVHVSKAAGKLWTMVEDADMTANPSSRKRTSRSIWPTSSSAR